MTVAIGQQGQEATKALIVRELRAYLTTHPEKADELALAACRQLMDRMAPDELLEWWRKMDHVG